MQHLLWHIFIDHGVFYLYCCHILLVPGKIYKPQVELSTEAPTCLKFLLSIPNLMVLATLGPITRLVPYIGAHRRPEIRLFWHAEKLLLGLVGLAELPFKLWVKISWRASSTLSHEPVIHEDNKSLNCWHMIMQLFYWWWSFTKNCKGFFSILVYFACLPGSFLSSVKEERSLITTGEGVEH